MTVWRTIVRYLPSFVLAFALSVAVWITAVTSSDPVEERVYPRTVPVDIVGQDPSLVITSEPPQPITITLSAPRSIWDRITNEQIPMRAVADLSGLKAGTHNVPIVPQPGIAPARVVSFSPGSFTVVLEELTTRTLPIQMNRRGDPAIGFQAETPALSQDQVSISGPKSIVERAAQVFAVLDLTGATETINRTLPLQVVDSNGNQISGGITLTPNQVTVTQVITQRGGFRNVVVKVIVVGTVATGYRLTNITVSPPAVTVFSTNPQLVNNLPGYIETQPLNINNIKQDFDSHQALNLPTGVSVVGDSNVLVQVGVAAIEGSLTFSNNKVEVDGLPATFSATVSPETVDVILSGPLPVLDTVRPESLRVYVDLSDVTRIGNYQRTPRVELRLPDLTVESILPESVEVMVIIAPPPTPTPIH
ncbi:MAG TPA: CdaR family protein [Anaerolineaceae bacterium]|nr:CdaR family protein [Anaerolineaceae bacterium]